MHLLFALILMSVHSHAQAKALKCQKLFLPKLFTEVEIHSYPSLGLQHNAILLHPAGIKEREYLWQPQGLTGPSFRILENKSDAEIANRAALLQELAQIEELHEVV